MIRRDSPQRTAIANENIRFGDGDKTSDYSENLINSAIKPNAWDLPIR
jgi:hypothetical protein